LVASGPIGCVGPEPIYLVSDRQIRLLRRKKLPFELVPATATANGHTPRPDHG
jgi:hypothetical protein